MFSKIKNLFSGIALIQKDAINYMESLISNKAYRDRYISLNSFHLDLTLFEEWKKEFLPVVKNAFNTKDKNQRMINLRVALIFSNKEYVPSWILLYEEKFTESDKAKIIAEIWKTDNIKDFYESQTMSFINNEATGICLRYLSRKYFNDSRENDFFVFHQETYKNFIDAMFRHILEKDEDGDSFYKSIVNTMKETLGQIEEKIKQGYNWDYDKKAIEEEEKQREAEQLANTPPKQRIVREHQIDELSLYLEERIRRMCNRELYNFEGIPPLHVEQGIIFDSGIMLIAINECVLNTDAALDALKQIIWKASIKINSNLFRRKEDIIIEFQNEMLKYYTEQESSFATIMLMGAASMFYEALPEKLSKEESKLIGEIGASMIPSAIEVMNNTKNIFGYKLPSKMTNE